MRDIHYKCRDIGYGIEEGYATGVWGERNWQGHRTFVQHGPLDTLYLFDDEVVSDEGAD